MTPQNVFSSIKNSSGKHKDWYLSSFIRLFASEIGAKDKSFNHKQFVKDYIKEHKELELKQRLSLISSLLNEHLKGNYKKKLKSLEVLLGEVWPYEEGMFAYGFHLYPVSQFVEEFGHEDLQASLDFIEKLTMRFTGEWAIRTIANADEKLTLKAMKKWAVHPHFHVRRLASEGLRARLPWGKKIFWISENPEKSLPIYNKLRNDRSLYVRRSVANSMGDMIKVNDELAYEAFLKWMSMKKTKENLWVIKHAIRNPVKKEVAKYIVLKQEVIEEFKNIGQV